MKNTFYRILYFIRIWLVQNLKGATHPNESGCLLRIPDANADQYLCGRTKFCSWCRRQRCNAKRVKHPCLNRNCSHVSHAQSLYPSSQAHFHFTAQRVTLLIWQAGKRFLSVKGSAVWIYDFKGTNFKVVIQYHWYNPKDSRDLIDIYLSNWVKRCRWQRWHTLPLWYVFTFIYFLHIFGKPSKLQYPKTIKTKVSSQSRLRICRPHGCNTTLWSHESSAAGGDCKPEIRNGSIYEMNSWIRNVSSKVLAFQTRVFPYDFFFRKDGEALDVAIIFLSQENDNEEEVGTAVKFHWLEHFFSHYCTFELSFFLPQGTWVKVARSHEQDKRPWADSFHMLFTGHSWRREF